MKNPRLVLLVVCIVVVVAIGIGFAVANIEDSEQSISPVQSAGSQTSSTTEESSTGSGPLSPPQRDEQTVHIQTDPVDDLLLDFQVEFATWMESHGAIRDDRGAEPKLRQYLANRVVKAINNKYELRPTARGRPTNLDLNLEDFRAVKVGGPVYYDGKSCTRCLNFTFWVESRDPLQIEATFGCKLEIFLAKDPKHDVLIGDVGNTACFEPKEALDEDSPERDGAPAPIERRSPSAEGVSSPVEPKTESPK